MTPSVRIYQQQRMTSIRTQEHGVLALKFTQTRLETSLSLSKVRPSTKLILRKQETKRYNISTTMNDFNSHSITWCTRIEVDSDSTRNLSISL